MVSGNQKKMLPATLFLPIYFLTFLLCLLAVLLQYLENHRFLTFTDALFRQEVCSSTLNLHYTLAVPANAQITEYPITFGHQTLLEKDTWLASCENQAAVLDGFHDSLLTRDNRLILAILKESCQASLSCPAASKLSEPLSPSLGIQAQLPVLLAEYTFRTKQDIVDYLGLLKTLPDYFDEIMAFEQQKSDLGLFMNDKAALGVIAQCSAFLQNSDRNYLLGVFEEKLASMSTLTKAEQAACLSLHKKLIKTSVIPAYQSLIDKLTLLLGTGKIAGGLSNYPEGLSYYTYLLRTQVGTEDSPSRIRERLLTQLQQDAARMRQLLVDQPQLAQDFSHPAIAAPDAATPAASGSDIASKDTSGSSLSDKLLTFLQSKIEQDFPALDADDIEIKYVYKDLQDYSSPAFYLTPPIDTNSPNSIYLNPSAKMNTLELFTTLAHEGFPGHLYQTVYFSRTNPQRIRHLYTPSGYVEGWATYVESYAYEYAYADSARGQLQWLNRSMSLCLYSLLDLGIHADGWSLEKATELLARFGVTDSTAISDIYQYILETPANYLKYYYGYLNFLDLRTQLQERQGTQFHLKDFHQQVLELGPMPFSLLFAAMDASL
ncbi:MAG: DUF885 domain-containing protein [Lachnospiraceae bacterium]|nr:DUF885 domain-containing protein [Lachnospiraceae bacterium]